MSAAIYTVRHAYDKYRAGHKDSIEDQTVAVRTTYCNGGSKSQHSIQNAYTGVGRHLFMGCYQSHLRDTHQIDDKGKKRKMQYPSGCRNPYRIYRHLIFNEPLTSRLSQHDDDYGYHQLDRDSSRIHQVQPISVRLAQFECNEPAHCSSQSTGNDREHADDSTHYIIYSVIGLTK